MSVFWDILQEIQERECLTLINHISRIRERHPLTANLSGAAMELIPGDALGFLGPDRDHAIQPRQLQQLSNLWSDLAEPKSPGIRRGMFEHGDQRSETA